MEALLVSRAMAAATSLADALDLRVNDAVVIHNSNKLALRLLPCDVFARVALVGQEVAALEVELAQRLAAIASPVAALEPRVEPRVYEGDGFAVTLWTYYEAVTPDPDSPSEYVRRPRVPVESPTLGLTHLQFEALLTAAKHSPNRCDFALVTMLGLLGLRIFEATGSEFRTLVRNTATECSGFTARATGSSSSRFHPPWAAQSSDPSTIGTPTDLLDPSRHPNGSTLRTRRLRRLVEEAGVKLPRMHPRTCSGTPSSLRCWTPDSTCATYRSPPATLTPAPPCATAMPARTSTGTPTTSSPRTWPRGPDRSSGRADERQADDPMEDFRHGAAH